MVGLLEDSLAATPEQLGDAARESREELAERHERVVASSLLALAALTDAAAPRRASASVAAAVASPAAASPAAATTADAVGSAAPNVASAVPEAELLERVAAVVAADGFWKRQLGAKSAPVRRAAYTFTTQLCGE